jgi:hypothetical protein
MGTEGSKWANADRPDTLKGLGVTVKTPSHPAERTLYDISVRLPSDGSELAVMREP